MSYTRLALALILAFVCCPDYARSQQNKPPIPKDLKEKAFNLLESAAGQLSTLQSAQNRARLGANIADSLWDHDEKRARALFTLIQEDINAGLANRDLDDPQDSYSIRVFLKLRMEIVERIAKYDGEFALTFLRSTEFVSDKPLPEDVTKGYRGLETRLARQMANNNPAQAVKLARKSLAEGSFEDLVVVLRLLSKKDKEQTLILYKEVVNKLRDTDFNEDWRARYFVEQLAQNFRPPTTDNSVYGELIGVIVTRALDQGCGNQLQEEDPKANFCRWAASVLPNLERIDPRAVQLKRWVNEELNINLAPEAIHEFYDLAEDGNVDNMLAYAARHPNVAELVYWEAIRRAASNGDLEQVRKILTQNVADSERKHSVLAEVDRRLKSSSVDDKKLADIQTGLKQFSTTYDRVRYLLAFADHYRVQDRNTTLKLLKQATDMVDLMRPGKEQTEAQIALALTQCLLKNDRGFAIMESILPKLNELVDAAVKLDGYETRYVSDGEWNMSANGPVGTILTSLSQNARNFAWYDFDRAVSLSAQFDRTEIRLMAQVKLAQAILEGPPGRPVMQIDFFSY